MVPVGVVPYLAVGDARAAIEWYTQALNAREMGDRYNMPDGRVGHAAMRVHGASFYLADAYPEYGLEAPNPDHLRNFSLVLTVPDTDETVARAVDAGATLEGEPSDNPYGRIGVVIDPFGHRWMIEGPVLAGQPGDAGTTRPGDLAYAALWTPDVEKAAAFYSAMLGWEVAAGSSSDGRQVTSTTLSTGLWGGQTRHTLFCCWQVDNVDAAVLRVRDAGGTVDAEPRDEPYGRIADCVDPQGLAFAVFAPPVGAEPGPRIPLNGAREGDLSYLTLQMVDRDQAVGFYAAVLGWSVKGDEDPADVHPMLGISGGHQEARAVPCWKVVDVPAALERVRAAGGRADEPDRRPYGLIAECVDDQGGSFWLSNA